MVIFRIFVTSFSLMRFPICSLIKRSCSLGVKSPNFFSLGSSTFYTSFFIINILYSSSLIDISYVESCETGSRLHLWHVHQLLFHHCRSYCYHKLHASLFGKLFGRWLWHRYTTQEDHRAYQKIALKDCRSWSASAICWKSHETVWGRPKRVDL